MTFEKVFLCGFFALLFASVAVSENHKDPLPSSLIPICSDSGVSLLSSEKTAKKNYELMLVQGTTQINNAFCGVASSVITFNSISKLPPPLDPYHGYPYWTQENFFSEDVSNILTFNETAENGIRLDQLGAMIQSWSQGGEGFHFFCSVVGKLLTICEANGTSSKSSNETYFYVKTIHTAQSSMTKFREEAWEYLATKGRVIVNFKRDLLQQEGSYGHFSPLVAYNPTKDMFLLFDVARYKFSCPTYWVPTDKLWKSMNSLDGNQTRGYILINTHTSSESEHENGIWKLLLILFLGGIFFGVIGLVIVLGVFTVIASRRSGVKKQIPQEEVEPRDLEESFTG